MISFTALSYSIQFMELLNTNQGGPDERPAFLSSRCMASTIRLTASVRGTTPMSPLYLKQAKYKRTFIIFLSQKPGFELLLIFNCKGLIITIRKMQFKNTASSCLIVWKSMVMGGYQDEMNFCLLKYGLIEIWSF